MKMKTVRHNATSPRKLMGNMLLASPVCKRSSSMDVVTAITKDQ